MSRLTELALSKRSVVLLLVVAVVFGAIYSWTNLKQELLPDIQLPFITIVAPYPGVSASDIETQVTRPIERAVGSVPRLQQLQSTSANSVAVVAAQFSYGTDIKETRSTIEQNLQSAGLPAGVTPTVSALDINATPVTIASISAKDGDLQKLGTLARTVIVPQLASLEGVSSVDVTGGLQQQAIVTLDPARLAATGVTVAQVAGVLTANNLTIPSGQLPVGTTQIPVSTAHTYATLDDIRSLIVGVRQPAAAPAAAPSAVPSAAPSAVPSAIPSAIPSTAPSMPIPVRLSDVATVELTGVPTTGYARTNGQPALTVSISKTSDANTVDVANEVRTVFGQLESQYGSQLTITTVSDLSTFITESRDGLLREGALGALFAILVIFLFLFSLRSTLVAAFSIPVSIFAALVLMLVGGVTINIMTLGGLAVAVGRVVDDAIVVLENIYRHRARGETRAEAVINGPREVAGAITASTITTVAVFLPIGFVGGLVSQFFLPFALTVTFALLASLVVALTVVPTLAYFFIDRIPVDVDEVGEPKRSLWIRVYEPTIRLVLRNRWTKWSVVGVAAILFVGSLALLPRIPTQFINAGSEKVLTIYLSPPAGTSSQAVLDQAVKVETKLLARPEVQLVQVSVPGEGDTGLQTIFASFTGRAANSAQLTVRLDPSTNLNPETKALIDALSPITVNGWTLAVTQTGGVGGSSSLQIIVSGPDQVRVAAATQTILGALKSQPDIINLATDLSKGTPEIQVTVDPPKAALVGSSTAQIGADVRAALSPATVTRVDIGDTTGVPVVLRVDSSAVSSVDALRQLPVGTVTKVPLGTVADVQQVDAQGTITRVDQAPASTISAEITSPDQGAVSRSVQKTIDGLVAAGSIPSTVAVRLAGVTQQQNEAFGGLFAAMAVAILLVYITLVVTFNSLITPFVIMFSLPLATIGAFPALLITGRPIGISALIGFLMLIGIVVTNAVVLLDLVERLRAQGEPTTQALVEGGKTRVRPILMTALATMLALIPLAAGLSEGSIIAAELGTVVIGGLFSSTFLTLIVVPVTYSLIDGGKIGLRRRMSRGGREASPASASPPLEAA